MVIIGFEPIPILILSAHDVHSIYVMVPWNRTRMAQNTGTDGLFLGDADVWNKRSYANDHH